MAGRSNRQISRRDSSVSIIRKLASEEIRRTTGINTKSYGSYVGTPPIIEGGTGGGAFGNATNHGPIHAFAYGITSGTIAYVEREALVAMAPIYLDAGSHATFALRVKYCALNDPMYFIGY